MRQRDFRYQAYYCEENAWWLARAPELADVTRWVVFVTNRERQCPIWHQRAGGPDDPVIWDYHVVVIASGKAGLQVYDLDTTLGFPVDLSVYLDRAFPDVSAWGPRYQPQFRVVRSEELLARFASDRRHMRDKTGGWQAPPPPWPPIQGAGAPHDLDRWLDLDAPRPGRWCRIEELSGALRRAEG